MQNFNLNLSTYLLLTACFRGSSRSSVGLGLCLFLLALYPVPLALRPRTFLDFLTQAFFLLSSALTRFLLVLI